MHSNALFSVFLPTHTHNLHYNYERPTIQSICLWTWPPDTNDAPKAQAHAPSLFWCHEFRRLKRQKVSILFKFVDADLHLQKAHQATEFQKQCRCLVCVLPHLRDRHGSCIVLDHCPALTVPLPTSLISILKYYFCVSLFLLSYPSSSPFLFDLRHFAHNMSLHSTVCDCRIYIWNVQERSWNMLERWHVEGQAMMLVDFNVPRWRFAIYLFSYYFNCTILLCF